ncbi:CaiB/BaiF CoA transferase family protein [Denitratisoma oestradiolicum]|uniref:L-carnitine dehydratase/bile acid-inducible protein F n=1 Tax=Denitratisoma oestradiolicum TaxID=311182 RepID=A0A6S6XVV7_9PROT|nr:CaiB/BaiF CoA-transferase family protein [Denitratisoma oestradiolicum]TWO80324.1 carnitine dehydratase [Denitratisoma oestradiolicum]CAB1370119.1 L-carnitine dehydratase/bile acid-inducible protein F [Denitratisoma oestradiolicum]
MAFLTGYTVLDLASVGPAARASRILADYGMNIIKVAPVAAKSGKQVDPVFHAYGAGRGTQKIRVDLKSDEGRAVIHRLAKSVDVVIESYRPGVATRLGVGYEDIKAQNAGIVYCSTSGYGQDGPYAQWVGHDINYLAVGGFLGCSGRDADGRPAIPGATVADSAGGGMQAAMSIIAALLQRSKTGQGSYLDVSITDGVLNLMSLYLDQYLATGEETKPNSAVLTGKYAWYGVYATGDGKHISVGAIEGHFFKNLCRLLDLEQYGGSQYDSSKQDEMKLAFQQRFLTRSRDEWVAALSGNDTCIAPVLSIAEVTADAHLRSRHAFMQANHPEKGGFEQLGPILAGGERHQPVHQVRPADVTDTQDVLQAAGFSPEEIASLRQGGSVE